MKLGIIDWGIGGVGLLNKVREKSSVDIVYYSDTGFTPYGKVPPEELENRVKKIIEYLTLNECKYIAVACNAASTVIPVEENIFGVILPAVEYVKELKIKKIGIAGGKRTIESNLYKDLLEKTGIETKQQIAQPLSARIEAGDLHSEEMKKDIATIFEFLKEEKHILLACTHYPIISNQINAFIPNTKLIDPIDKMAEQVLAKMIHVTGQNKIRWATSGSNHEMALVLKKVYNIDTYKIERNTI